MPRHTQRDVNYRRGYPMRQCGVCDMFRKTGSGQYGSCTAVTGQITPYGLCNLWDKMTNPYGHRMTPRHRAAIEDIYDHAHGYSVPK
jgi:hypothetical protein